jgi:hypothetical protein
LVREPNAAVRHHQQRKKSRPNEDPNHVGHRQGSTATDPQATSDVEAQDSQVPVCLEVEAGIVSILDHGDSSAPCDFDQDGSNSHVPVIQGAETAFYDSQVPANQEVEARGVRTETLDHGASSARCDFDQEHKNSQVPDSPGGHPPA